MKEALAKPVRVVSIDPGLSGAVALAGHGDLTLRRDFKSERGIAEAAVDLISLCGDSKPLLVVELVGARPGQGVCSMFSFGLSTGVGLGALYAALRGHEVERVHPLKWTSWYKKQLGLGKGERIDSRQIATDLFPQFACYFKRKKDHNSADAFLIALWKLNHL